MGHLCCQPLASPRPDDSPALAGQVFNLNKREAQSPGCHGHAFIPYDHPVTPSSTYKAAAWQPAGTPVLSLSFPPSLLASFLLTRLPKSQRTRAWYAGLTGCIPAAVEPNLWERNDITGYFMALLLQATGAGMEFMAHTDFFTSTAATFNFHWIIYL